jgi:hypothetical protein
VLDDSSARWSSMEVVLLMYEGSSKANCFMGVTCFAIKNFRRRTRFRRPGARALQSHKSGLPWLQLLCKRVWLERIAYTSTV